MWSKNGQSANRTGLMIILITVVLIIYILFIPPDAREDLLNSQNPPSPGENGEQGESYLVVERFLNQQVGQLDYISRNRERYSIPAHTVSTSVDGTTIQQRESLSVKRTLFDEEQRSIQFSINKDVTEDIILSFKVNEGRGKLLTELNGEEIYEEQLKKGNSPPIRINSDELRDGENTITFKTDSPGITFWRANQYNLENIAVTGDVQDVSQQAVRQELYVQPDDIENIERTRIQYVPVCDEDEVSSFEIRMNNFRLFQGVPDCNVINTIQFNPDAVFSGDNEIITRVETGNVLVDNFELTTYFQDTQSKQYFFTVPQKYFFTENGETQLYEEYLAELDLVFTNNEEKRVNLYINGRLHTINTRESRLTKNVTEDLIPGSNAIEIEPVEDLTISRLQLNLLGRE